MSQANSLRPFSGWIIKRLEADTLEVGVSHLPPEEEYWLALRHPSEVATVGLDLLKGTYPGFSALTAQEQESVWREFRAYTRQAENFYRAASALHWKSSPLNYYYSFMNLAKSMMILHGVLPPKPASHPRKLRHGLSAAVLTGTPDKWTLTSQASTDIFPQLYKLTIGAPLASNTVLDALELLRYVSAVAWQLYKCKRGPSAWYAGRWVIVTTPSAFWDILAFPKEADLTQLPSGFAAEYQEVSSEAAKKFAVEVLGLQAMAAMHTRFLQRTTPFLVSTPGTYDTAVIERGLKAAAPHCVFPYLHNTQNELALGMPYRTGGITVPMNELAASYAIMYFLSSLVRYHPDYMDSIGESSDAWLVETFAKTAPLTLLRYLATGALGHQLIIEPT